jgi:MoxR-like ATPase
MLKLIAAYPDAAELSQIIDRTTGEAMPPVERVLDAAAVLELRALVREVVIAGHVKEYAIRVVLATHPEDANALPMARRYARHGASPRAVQAMVLAAKAMALFAGRMNVSFDDLKAVAGPALRHRILLNFEGEAEGISTDDIVDEVVRDTPVTTGHAA